MAAARVAGADSGDFEGDDGGIEEGDDPAHGADKALGLAGAPVHVFGPVEAEDFLGEFGGEQLRCAELALDRLKGLLVDNSFLRAGIVFAVKPVNADIILKNGDLIGDYEVIHTPGHTPGSICLYNPDNKVIFVGDNLNYSKGKIRGPSSRLLPEPDQYKKSMKKLGDLDIEVILPGHGPAVTADANKKLAEFLDQIS